MSLNNIPSSYAKNYLPSKKIIILAGILVLGGFLYFIIPRVTDYYQTHKNTFSLTGTPPEPYLAAVPTETSFDKDTDGDGIPDWQETVFGLNPNKKDTDGDGIPDVLPKINGTSVGDLVSLPDTEKLTLAVYNKFQDTPTDTIKPTDVQATTSDEILTHAQEIESSLKKYTALDLEIIDSDKNTITTYQKSVYDIFNNTVDDPVIMVKNIQEKILKGNGDVVNETDIINKVIKKLVANPVPSKVKTLHLSLLNAAYYISQVLAMPKSDDELTVYTRSIIAQKNINVIQQSLADIATVGSAYSASPN